MARGLVAALAMLGLAACGERADAPGPTGLIKGDAMPAPLTQQPGNAEEGRAIFVERGRGHCVLCHALDAVDAPFQGNVGPDLTGIAARLSPDQVRLRVANPRAIWPDTVMPAYYRSEGLNQVDPAFAGQTILTAQEIEDVVAFLSRQHARDARDDG